MAFLVDILLFIPHLSLGSYIVVGTPICLAIVVVGLFTTRRRVVGKKDRKRRIAETATTNTHAGNIDPNPNSGFIATHGTTGVEARGPVSGHGDKLPEFATFEVARSVVSDGPLQDETGERIPLNPRHQSPPPAMGLSRVPTETSQGSYSQQSQSFANYPGNRPQHAGLNQHNIGPLPPSHRLPLNPPPGSSGAFGPPGAQQYGSSRFAPGPNGPRGPPSGPYRGGPPPQPGYFGQRGPGMMAPQADYSMNEPPRGLGNNAIGGPYAGPPPMTGFNEGNNYGIGVAIIPRGVSPGMHGPGPRHGPSPQQQQGGYYQEPPPPVNDRGYHPQGAEHAWPNPPYNDSQIQQQPQQHLGAGDYHSDDDSRMDVESRGQPSREGFIATALAPGPGAGAGRGPENDERGGIEETGNSSRALSYVTEDGSG